MSSDPRFSGPSLPPLPPDQQVKPRRFELRMSLLFAAVFVPNGFYLPYFPLWLKEAGFDAAQIAVLIGAPMFVRVLTGPTISALADRAPDRVPVLTGLAVAGAIVTCGYLLPPTYVLVLTISLLFSFFWGPHNPLSDSLGISGARRYGADYPGMRLWGSVSFLIANVAGGFAVARSGIGIFPFLLIGSLCLLVATCFAAPRLGRPRRPAPIPTDVLPQAAPILRSAYFLIFLLASALVQASHAQLYTFGSIYWESLGIDPTAIGALWASAVLAEVLMFMFFRKLFRRFSTPVILVIGTVGAMFRWAALPLVWPLGFGLAGLFAVQALHGFSFSLCFLATQRMIAETVPEDRMGAAQGANYFAAGFFLCILTFAAGPLYATFGAASFAAMSGVSAAGFVLAVVSIWLAPKPARGREDG